MILYYFVLLHTILSCHCFLTYLFDCVILHNRLGGSLEECTYVDGVVFRKTVSHKKMMLVEESKHDEANDINNKVNSVCV